MAGVLALVLTFGCKKNTLEHTSTGAGDGDYPQQPPLCFQHETESRPSTFNRQLLVHINNTCTFAIDCEMTTDANDRTFEVKAGPYGLYNLLVDPNSERREFRANFQCTWER